jgi:3D (Asp-Asp-Asp) domain-containing protein
MRLAWVRRNLKKYVMGRGLPLTIAIVWISSLAAYTLTDAWADQTPMRAALTRQQPLRASLSAAAAHNPGRPKRPHMSAGAAGTKARTAPASLNAGIGRKRRLTVGQSPLPTIQTKSRVGNSPRTRAPQHERAAAHLMKVSSFNPRPPVAAGPMHTLQVWVTGYDLYGATATGVPTGPGICAVDPYTIPLGTHVAIAGVGRCVAADTGPAVTGAHIDVWVPDYQSAVNLTGWYTASW